jgi:hypothetical protein
VHGGREAVLRRQPVVERHHRGAAAQRELAAQAVVGLESADREAAAVQVEQHGGDRAVRRVQARAQRVAVARLESQRLDTRQRRARQVQHLGAGEVGGARLQRREPVVGRVSGALDALQDAAHRRG